MKRRDQSFGRRVFDIGARELVGGLAFERRESGRIKRGRVRREGAERLVCLEGGCERVIRQVFEQVFRRGCKKSNSAKAISLRSPSSSQDAASPYPYPCI